LICVTASVSATAQEGFDDLLRRLEDVEAEQAESQETIKALRLEIEELRTKIEDDQPTEQRAEEIPAAETDIPADVVVQESLPPGPGRQAIFPELADESQFVLRSRDGNFSLGIFGTIINRYELNRRKDDGTGSSDTDQGFELTGLRINFQGELYGNFGYWARINADNFGDDPIIDAALGWYHFNDHSTIVVGQFPSLLIREQAIPADKLQAAESSPTNYTFDPFGYKGVMLAYHTPRMVYRGIINDGYRSANNAFFDEPSAKWALAGQVSGLAVGDENDWDRFNNFTSRRGSDFAWLLNGAFHVQEGDTHGSSDTGSDDLFLGVVESSMEGDGWNFYASGYYRYTDLRSDRISVNDLGFVLLGGVWVSKHFEIYSRFDMTIPDSDRLMEGDEFKTLTAGVNFYPFPHTDNIRVNVEGLFMFDAEANSIVEPNVLSSVRESPAGDQAVFRTSVVIQW
jgi:hypothetical protein